MRDFVGKDGNCTDKLAQTRLLRVILWVAGRFGIRN